MTQARTAVYVAADEEAAREGSTRLEDADSALEAEPVVGLAELRTRAPVADCVVFAETPTTAEGANLLEVIDASRETPIVLFTGAEYGATTARSTEGVDGYVRRDTDGAFEHLADEIAWVCHGDDETKALPGATDESGDVLAALPEGVFAVDATGRITYANEWLGEFLGVDANGLPGVTLRSLAGSGILSAADVDAIEAAVEGVLSGDARVSELSVEIATDDGVREVSLRVAADGDVATVSVRPTDDGGSGPAGDPGSGTTRSTVSILRELASDVADCRDEERLLEVATTAAERALPSDAASILLCERGSDGERLVPKAVAGESDGLERREIPPDEGLTGEVFRDGRARRVADFREDDAMPVAGDDALSAVVAPIGEFGVLRAVSREADRFDEADREAAALLATQVAAALRRIRTAERLRDREERLTRVTKVASDIAAADGIDDAAERTVGAVRAVVETDGVALLLAEGTGTNGTEIGGTAGTATNADGADAAGTAPADLVPVASEGAMAAAGADAEPAEGGAVREASRSGDVVVRSGDETGFERFDSVVAAPVDDGGVLEVVSSEADGFDDADRRAIEVLAVVLGETIARLRIGSALEGALDRLETVFETLPDPAVRYEVEAGRAVVREVNPAFADAFGIDRESVSGRPLEELVAPVSGETRDPIDVLTREGSDQVTTRRRIGGELRDVRLTVVPLESDGRIVEGVAIYTDVTEQVRRERELEARSERLDEFANIVGQDLRSPLNVARGYLELAEATGDAEHFEEIESAHERIDVLIGQLLSLLRVDDVDGESGTDPVSLHGVVRDAWGAVDTGSAGLRLEDDARFRADRELVTELLENLVANCVEHGADDGGPITVRVGATDAGFYVADDGVGIDPDERDAVLESGFTTADDRTGYGLTIVQRIATAHGWTIDLDESDAGGTRVSVTGVDLETDADDGDTNGDDADGEDGADEGDLESEFGVDV